MTFEEMNAFYQQDDKKYELKNNQEILIWLNHAIENGYQPYFSISELQELIDFIVNWYEKKYPEEIVSKMDQDERVLKSFFDIPLKHQEFLELKKHLSFKQLCILEANYRFKNDNLCNEGENVTLLNNYAKVDIQTKDIKEKFSFYVNRKSGFVNIDPNFKKYFPYDTMKIEQLYNLLSKQKNIETEEIKKSIYNHIIDYELIRKLLQLVALKLLYSKNTTVERGYIRSKNFIFEMNQEYYFLSEEDIKNKMDRDYRTIETNKIKKLINTFFHKI